MKTIRLQSAQALVCAGVLMVLAVLGMGAYRTVEDEYRHHVDKILLANDRTAHQLAMRTAAVFDRVNQSTLVVKFARSEPVPASIASLTHAGVVASDLLQSLYITNTRGFLVDQTSDDMVEYVADEDFFKWHKKAASADIHIGEVRLDPLSGKPGLPVTRRLEVEGTFNGIVNAMVDPAVLTASYSSDQPAGSVIAVAGADGVFRSRLVDGQLTFGAKMDIAAVIQRLAETRRTGIPSMSRVDGVKRFGAVVKIERYSLYAVVAVKADVALADYRAARGKIFLWAAFSAVGTLIAGGLLLRLAKRLDISRVQTKKAEMAFRAALDGSLDAVFILEAKRNGNTSKIEDLLIADCNDRAANATRLSREAVVGCMLGDLMPFLRGEGLLSHFEYVLSSRKAVSGELHVNQGPMAGRWLHHQVVPLDDDRVALISRDITQRKTAEAELESLTRVDGLTSLLNRRAFESMLDDAVARAERSWNTLALLYIDLDGFKQINDRFGHATGDQVLIEVAHRLKATVRNVDAVARLGGDEFAVILENAGGFDGVFELCERVLEALREAHPIEGEEMFATPSIGVALLEPHEPPRQLCKRADDAMYKAKEQGKSRWVLSEVISPDAAFDRVSDDESAVPV